MLQCALQNFLQLWPVETWPEPVRRHVPGFGSMVFDRIYGREVLRKRLAKSCEQPILVALDNRIRIVASLDEILDAVDHEVDGQPMEIDLRRMLDPMAPPIVVAIDLAGFV